MDLKKFAPENISTISVEELQSLTPNQIIELGKMYPNTKYRQPYLVAVPRGKDKEMPVTASWAIVASWIGIGFKNFKILGTYENYMAEMSKNQSATTQDKPVVNLGELKVDLSPVNLEDNSKNQSEESGSEKTDQADKAAESKAEATAKTSTEAGKKSDNKPKPKAESKAEATANKK